MASAGVVVPDVYGIFCASGGEIHPAHARISAPQTIGTRFLGVLCAIGLGDADLGHIWIVSVPAALKSKGTVGLTLTFIADGAFTDTTSLLTRTFFGTVGRFLNHPSTGVDVPNIILGADILPGEPTDARAATLEPVGAATIGVRGAVRFGDAYLWNVRETTVPATPIAFAAFSVTFTLVTEGAVSDTAVIFAGPGRVTFL